MSTGNCDPAILRTAETETNRSFVEPEVPLPFHLTRMEQALTASMNETLGLPAEPGSPAIPEQAELVSAEASSDSAAPHASRPPGTIEHLVGARETFTSLSIKYDMNKAEICRLNKIHSGVVFPGQTILLKDPVHPEDYVPPPQRSLSASSIQEGSGESDSVTITTEDNQGRPEVTEIVTEQSLEFVNNTMFRVKSLYLTVDKGIVPGILEGSCDYMRFTPTNTPAVREFGPDIFTLAFEYEDLLGPNTQRKAPKLSEKPRVGPGFALHREEPEQAQVDDKPQPIFLQIRVRLVFGVEPTPDTTAAYWFAVMPRWLDRVYNILHNAAKLHEIEPWHLIKAPEPDSYAPGVGGSRLSDVDETVLRGGESQLLKSIMVSSITRHLPIRCRYSDWVLGFSTYVHGLSIGNMYRTLLKDQKKPCITVLKDNKGHVFGCYTTECWKVTKDNHFYGGGEAFVFTVDPEHQFFNWSQSNKYFQMSTENEMMIGGGSGAAALWIDGDLTRGCSKPSKTFNNICLAGSTDFIIEGFEVWILDSSDDF